MIVTHFWSSYRREGERLSKGNDDGSGNTCAQAIRPRLCATVTENLWNTSPLCSPRFPLHERSSATRQHEQTSPAITDADLYDGGSRSRRSCHYATYKLMSFVALIATQQGLLDLLDLTA